MSAVRVLLAAGLASAVLTITPAAHAAPRSVTCPFAFHSYFSLYLVQPQHHTGGVIHGNLKLTQIRDCPPVRHGFVEFELQAYFGYPYFGWVNVSGPKPLNIAHWRPGETKRIRTVAKCPPKNRKWRTKLHVTRGFWDGHHYKPYNLYYPKRRGELIKCQ